ncbi:GNAT family N-acetyltransferase [Salinicoccus sp. YB14-2]|uniref:GNAT family N-acetyltransferase n=1 Tax=Salinicoccus sp. YB14-2 TaxID=1572701 RepID=UPI00068EF580|nr:GNAT family N-acetyltransferase [Salinicoccus sp. YB14-2]
MDKIYYSDRLVLRHLNDKHAGIVLDYYKRNKEFLGEWEALREEEFYTLDAQKKLLNNDVEAFKEGRAIKFWIFKREDANKVIGCVSFQNIVRSIMQSCILGYKLDGMETGQGYISEALEKSIDLIFSEYNLHRIEAPVMPKNIPSIKVLDKLGFVEEGMTKKILKVNGVWEDHLRYSLLSLKYK